MPVVDAVALGFEDLLSREWISTNRLGGYASSSACGLNTRKYHGLLVAAMAPPVRRMVLLSRIEETVLAGDAAVSLACSEYPGVIHPRGDELLRKFSTDPFPRWAYQADGFTIEKSLRLIAGENTVVVNYTLLAGDAPVDLELRPLFALRGIHELSYQWNGRLDAESRSPDHHRIPPTSRTPEAFFAHDGTFEQAGCWYMSTIYRRESERGYAGLEDLWMPGVVRLTLSPGQTVHFVCSTEPIDLAAAIARVEKQHAEPAKSPSPRPADPALDGLLRAADQFIVESPKASIGAVTQYPWSPPSGRDALIGFAGLFLIPQRFEQGLALLESMAAQLRDGLMPTEFAEDGSPVRYCGADTSLWYLNAVHEYLRYTHDDRTVRSRLLETIVRIIRCYQVGTALGISIDSDGLVCSHAPGEPTSWMNAKVGEWVITPRQGRTVELNALWYNALRIAAGMCEKFDHLVWAGEFVRLADSVRRAFNRKFWNELSGCCFDVVNDRGADPSIRPNQLLAMSLPHAVLDPQRHAFALDRIRSALLTPLGVRSLGRNDPSYQGRYRGDVVSRDRAHHQGSAFPWLLGPLATAMVRTYGRAAHSRNEARKVLDGCLRFLQSDGLGQLPELFDGDAPHTPGGATASARSVGAILQAYVEDVLDQAPHSAGVTVRTNTVRPPIPL